MKRSYLAAILVMFVLHAGTAAANRAGEQAAGDAIEALLPVLAFGTAYFKDDSLGVRQWMHDTALHEVLFSVLVVGFNQTSLGKRPRGGGYSFPSGHAGFAFAQAGFLQERYGWEYGAPALALATAVSYIRVDIRKHHWRDVIAGSALGYSCALLTTTPLKALHLAPTIGPGWMGLRYERSF